MKPTSVCCLLVLAVTLTAEAHQAPRVIKSNAVTRVKSSAGEHRQRRQAETLTPNQKTELVAHHNVLRAMEGADNMELMVRPGEYLGGLAPAPLKVKKITQSESNFKRK